jgi:glycosyltransferase involved in cell wall biosynthesis
VYFRAFPDLLSTTPVDSTRAWRFRVCALARRLHRERCFDLIHAHFLSPDGVVATPSRQRAGRPGDDFGRAFWTPWLVDQPRVRSQVDAALPGIRLVTAVSDFLRQEIDAYGQGCIDTAVLPNVVDDVVFSPAPRRRDPDELLYVGVIRRVKRVDVLLRALAEARRSQPALADLVGDVFARMRAIVARSTS